MTDARLAAAEGRKDRREGGRELESWASMVSVGGVIVNGGGAFEPPNRRLGSV